MAKTDVFQFDSTAGNNTDINSIDIAESCNPSGINNAIRQLMAYIRDYTKTVGGAAVSSGTDTVTLTTAATITAYADGMPIGFIAGGTNTGAVTLNVDSVGAKAIRKKGDAALEAGDIVSGMPCLVFYDASANSGSGAWMLLNPVEGIDDVVEDTTPQLGGDLDVNGNSITSASNGDVTVDPNGTGTIILGAATVTVEQDIVHSGDTNNLIQFGTDTQDFQTGGSSRMDISDSGVRLGGANARVTTVLDEDAMGSDSATALATQQSIKAYVDSIVPDSAAIAKFWAYVTVSGGTPTLQTSYNVTSIADTAAGRLTVTIATDFSSVNWCSVATIESTSSLGGNGETICRVHTKAAGSVLLESVEADGGQNLGDPAAWNVVGFGAQ